MGLQSAIQTTGAIRRVTASPRHRVSSLNPGSRWTVAGSRSAFTLIELLVAITIFLILLGLAVGTLTVLNSSERPRSSARQIQSYLEGARNQAMFAKEPRGVRFLLDPSGNTVSSMVTIGAPGEDIGTLRVENELTVNQAAPWTQNTAYSPTQFVSQATGASTGLIYECTAVAMMPTGESGASEPTWPTTPGQTVVDNEVTWTARRPPFRLWSYLADLGALVPGGRIKIPNDSTGIWYPIADASFQRDMNHEFIRDPATGGYLLTRANSLMLARRYTATNPAAEYMIELAGQPLPDTDPMPLARGIVIELDASRGTGKLPAIWHNGSQYQSLDLTFSPRGTVMGPAAATGVIHLVLSDVRDYEQKNPCGGRAWSALQTYSRNDVVLPNDDPDDFILNGGLYFRATGFAMGNSGVSGMSQPTWPTLPNQTVSDGDITWTSGTLFEDGVLKRVGDTLIVSIFTRTGNVATSPINIANPYDWYGYAETGATAR